MKEVEEVIPDFTRDLDEEKRDLLSSLRLLLKQYPLPITFRAVRSEKDYIFNVLQIYDLLVYCRHKTLKQPIRDGIDKELAFYRKLQIDELRLIAMKLSKPAVNFNTHRYISEAIRLLSPHFDEIANRTQFFSLALPFKELRNMHMDITHGLPPAVADEYEEQEVAAGLEYEAQEGYMEEEAEEPQAPEATAADTP